MPPKKREKDGETSKNIRADHIQADHELFLQAFEKPTQIYRFLRTRNMLSPIFLNRTLSYMKHRMSRTNASRRTFKVDSLLDQVLSSRPNCKPIPIGGQMTLTFNGFYSKNSDLECYQCAQVETILLKICHKKRKESVSPLMQIMLGVSEVVINPSEESAAASTPVITVPTETFNFTNGHIVKSYMLVLRVQCFPNQAMINENADSQPPQKRRKSSTCTKIYGSELVIYDKHNRCLLTDGDYELSLQEVSMPTPKISPKKYSNWESIGADVDDSSGPFDVFKQNPTLKLKLKWSRGTQATSLTQKPKVEEKENSQKHQIVYQFLYNNNSRQQTEACEDLHCPWCSLDCGYLYSLLKHLRLCHARFTFTYVPLSQTGGARIDVAINELYDGSYAGTPHALAGPRLPATGPTRRAPVTRLLVLKPHKSQHNLSEFLQQRDECERDARRPYLAGHARLYHHTGTCLPVWPQELDCDSEGENDPDWLRTKTRMMIDDFTDVNEGEKELMKLWNLHVMKCGFVGDCQIPLACIEFVRNRGKEILVRNLYRNFILHLSSLFDFGLISPVTLYSVIRMLQGLEGAPEGAELARINSAVEQQVAATSNRYNGHGVGHRRKLSLAQSKNVCN